MMVQVDASTKFSYFFVFSVSTLKICISCTCGFFICFDLELPSWMLWHQWEN